MQCWRDNADVVRRVFEQRLHGAAARLGVGGRECGAQRGAVDREPGGDLLERVEAQQQRLLAVERDVRRALRRAAADKQRKLVGGERTAAASAGPSDAPLWSLKNSTASANS